MLDNTRNDTGDKSEIADNGALSGGVIASTNILTGTGDNRPRSHGDDRFHDLFVRILQGSEGAQQAKQIAIELEDETLSFGELEGLSNRIGHLLQRRGAKPGDVIIILLDRTVHSYASVLAVSKIGCTFVPLDVSFPVDRIEFICSDAGASFALTISFHARKFADTGVDVVALDEAEEDYARLPATPPNTQAQADPDADCYVIYTSGTTGRPKGVPVSHASICNFLLMAVEEYGFLPSDRVFQSLTLAFDYSFEEIWVPLLSGACLVPAPPEVSLIGADLAEFLREKQITAWCSVPTILSTISGDLPDLRLLIVSGEACPRNLVSRWSSPQRRMLNLYGPTETTVSATWKELHPDSEVTIGTPLPTYTAMILKPEADELAEPGEEGEIAIGGIGVTAGYLNRPDETARAFIADFLDLEDNPGGKLYRTGDLGRITTDGEIEYLGRLDTQIKIRGYRIELGEIESVAREVSAIDDLVVNPVEMEAGQIELAAYYAAPSGGTIDEKAIHDALREVLPHYMVPSYFVCLEAIPTLPSQKVDRKKLPQPDRPRILEDGQEFIPPEDGIEADLAEVLASVLKIERVSANADFFEDLGANSLVMARFLGALRKKLGLKKASMKQIYQHSNIRELGAVLSPGEPAPKPVGIEIAVPCDSSDAKVAQCTNEAAVTPTVSAPTKAKVERPLEIPVVERRSDFPMNPDEGGSDPQHIVPDWQFALFGVAQIAWMLAMAFVITVPLLAGIKWIAQAADLFDTYLRSFFVGGVVFAGSATALIAIKWCAVGRFKKAKIPMWGLDHLRFWIAQTAIRANPLNLLIGTPAYNIFLRALGAEVGKGSLIYTLPPTCADLISVGEDVVIRRDCLFSGYTARNGFIHTGHVSVGSRSYISEATVLEINSSIGPDAQLGTRSALHENQTVPGDRNYMGSPAVPCETDFIRVPELENPGVYGSIYAAGQLLYLLLFVIPVPVVLGIFLVDQFFGVDRLAAGESVSSTDFLNIVALTTGLYFALIAFAMLQVSTLPRLFNLLFRPEQPHRVFGFQYFLARRIEAASNSILLQTLFGDSSLIMPYYRAVGYDLSEATQNGSNFGIEQRQQSPFLCKFNRNTLVSDGLAMLNMDLGRTSFRMSPISVPPDAYLGNDLHYPTGAKVGVNCLIATKAMIPIDGPVRENVGILGSPPFEIPRSGARDARLDHYRQPGIFEKRLQLKLKSNLVTLGLFLVRNISAALFSIIAFTAIYDVFSATIMQSPFIGALILSTTALATTILTCFYFIAYERLANWYRPMKPRICSLYERPFWDHERFWKMNVNLLMNAFNGTPLKNVMVRCQGVKLGRQVFDDGASISEPHMVEIGDFSVCNFHSTVQGHSLEDGTFKSDAIRIGANCTLGVSAFVHYGSVIGDEVDVRTDAFVMKGSIIQDGETWIGNPAQPLESSASQAENQILKTTTA